MHALDGGVKRKMLWGHYEPGLVMIAELDNECISLSVLSVARVQFPVVVENFKGFSAD